MAITTYRMFVLGVALLFNLGAHVTAADPPAAADKLTPAADKLPAGAVLQFGHTRFQSPTFGGHASFSPDGKLLATSQNVDGVSVWDLTAGKIVRTNKAAGGSIIDLRWRADGKLIALFWFGPSGFIMAEWKDAKDPELSGDQKKELAATVREKSDDHFNHAFFLDDDHVGAVFFKNIGPPPSRHEYRLEVYRMVKPEGTVKIQQWEWLAGKSLDGKVMFFYEHEKLNAYDRLAVARGEEKPLWSFETHQVGGRDRRPHECVSLDGKQVVVSFLGGDLELWDGPTGKLIRSYPTASMYVYPGRGGESIGLALSPDGKRMAVMTRTEAGEAGGRIIEVATGKEVVAFTPEPMPFLKQVFFSPDGKQLAQIGDGQLRLLNAETGADINPGSGHRGEVTSVMASSDGKNLVSAGTDQTVRGWDLATGREKWKTAVPQEVYLRFVTGDSVVIEQSSHNGEVAKPLLDLKDGTARALPGDMGKKHDAPKLVLGPPGLYDSLLAISSDAKTAATLDLSGPAIRIWSWPAGKLEKTWSLEIPKDFYLLGAKAWYTPSGKELLVALQCTHQGGLRAFYPVLIDRFETATGKRLDRQKAEAMQNRLIPDDGGVVQVTGLGEVRDLVADKLIVKLEQTPTKPFIVWNTGGMALSPDGESLAVGGARGGQGQIEIYDLKNGKVRKALETGSQASVQLLFLADGRLISSGDRVLLWSKP